MADANGKHEELNEDDLVDYEEDDVAPPSTAENKTNEKDSQKKYD